MINIIIVVLSVLLLPLEILNQGCIGKPAPDKQLIPSADNWITLETLELSIRNYPKEIHWGFLNCESITYNDDHLTKK